MKFIILLFPMIALSIGISSCQSSSLAFPDNIAFEYRLDNIHIDNPVIIETEGGVFISSLLLLDSLNADNISRSKYAYPMYTEEDLDNYMHAAFLGFFKNNIKDTRFKGRKYEGNFLYYYYDFTYPIKSCDWCIVHKFLKDPLCFVLYATRPNSFSCSLENGCIVDDLQFISLSLAPVFRKKDIKYYDDYCPTRKTKSIRRHPFDNTDSSINEGLI